MPAPDSTHLKQTTLVNTLMFKTDNYQCSINCGSFGGRDGGLVVNVLAFYSNDPSSNPAGYLNFLYKKTKINKKETGLAEL